MLAPRHLIPRRLSQLISLRRPIYLLALCCVLGLLAPVHAQQGETRSSEPPAAAPVQDAPAAGAAADDSAASESEAELPFVSDLADALWDRTPVELRRWIDEQWDWKLLEVGDQVITLGPLLRAGVLFVVILLVGWILIFLIRLTLLRRLRSRADAAESLVFSSLLEGFRHTKAWAFVLLAAYLALLGVPLTESWRRVLHSVALIVVTVQAAIWLSAAVMAFLEKTRERQAAEDPSTASALGLIGFFARVAIWSAVLLLVLTNLGYEIGPLLAGLGVGGVAVAFALQSILGDIFCSVAIILDKPFVLGDFIIVGDLMGTVEHIGIKTTRLRSLGGEQLIFSNADLVSSRIRNYKRMRERRVVFAFGVVYETSAEQLRGIPERVRSIVEGVEQTRFDRAHFKQFGDFSLDFEVVYYVLSPDYNLYMDIQQDINLRLFDTFEEAGIDFAYPTREIIMRPQQPSSETAAR